MGRSGSGGAPYTGKSPIRICLAQTVLPSPEGPACDFDPSDPLFSRPQVRRRLRRHLSAVLSGITQMLVVRDTHRDHGHKLDWLILPELSVHPDDVMPILVPFVRRHKCLVLAGLLYHRVPSETALVNEALWILPHHSREGGLRLMSIFQGKQNLAPIEALTFGNQITGYRPCQWLIEYEWSQGQQPLVLTGSICYDATDLRLAADLRDKSDVYAIPALNKDITTFDTMTQALHYHMYQMVILVNTGTYGGSSAYAPYSKPYQRQIFHIHGQPQAAIAFMEIEDPLSLLRRGQNVVANRICSSEEHPPPAPLWKQPPAGRIRR
jgi:hypothetical protein